MFACRTQKYPSQSIFSNKGTICIQTQYNENKTKARKEQILT